MSLSRRAFLAGLGSSAALAALRGRAAAETPAEATAAPVSPGPFPRRADFELPGDLVYLNSAYSHPMSSATAAMVRSYADWRARPEVRNAPWPSPGVGAEVKQHFADLIGARPAEISFIPNTSTGENLVVQGLGIPRPGGNVVTDALHFEGSLLHFQALQRERGLDLRMVMPRDNRIAMADLERVVDRHTTLVAISLVAMFNGFQHDLRAVCDLAHAHGALVYADIIQAAGATPIDVRATNVDFCSCSSFKWLMGDFGLGFLYVREDLLDRVVKRTQYGYMQSEDFATHYMPWDEPGPQPLTWTFGHDAAAHFEVGSVASAARAALSVSLPYVKSLGVERIEVWRQPLLERLRRELPALGFPLMTPPESRSALITFGCTDGQAVSARLQGAHINARVGRRFLRLSPSVFNDLGDIDRLLEALS